MKHSYNNLIFLSLILFLFSCSDNFLNPTNNNKLELGNFQEVLNGTISPKGGKIDVETTDSTLSGLSIEALEGAYKDNMHFVVSTAEIKGHSFGEKFHPIAPLIRIKNGGGYSEGITFVTVPIEIGEDEIPVAFFYDDQNNKLEPIPVVYYSTSEIIFASRHFQTNSSSNPKGVYIQNDNLYSNVVLSSVKEEDLLEAGVLTSGFTPGNDDWEFPNYGTYVEPEGCCSGHSISALWYFNNRKSVKNKQLYQCFDT